jgi:cytochrome c oxidase cbb3-type subunit 1
MSLSGAWHKLRTDPIIKFLITALAFYAMATFEGPMLSIKAFNALSHNTDWTIGHVHSGALGWVAMMTIGSMYHLIPLTAGRKFGQMFSIRLINLHFWLATLGTVIYIASMWVNGIMQGLMWRAVGEDGMLTYSFVESVEASYPGYFARFIGGCLFLSGMLIMAYNVYKTYKAPIEVEESNQSNSEISSQVKLA